MFLRHWRAWFQRGSSTTPMRSSRPAQANVRVRLGLEALEHRTAPALLLPVGADPTATALADFNGDGKADIVVVDSFDDNVSVFLNTPGKGAHFQPAQNFDAGASPTSVAVGDFNGDGKKDLAVANQDPKTVSVLLGRGDGSFQAPTSYAVANRARVVVAADFNKDGKQDLAVGTYGGSSTTAGKSLSVLLGNGDGTFQSAKHSFYLALPTAYIRSLAVGDLNRDGKLDLAIVASSASGAGRIYAANGNGAGAFAPIGLNIVPINCRSIAIADFNKDGRPDLAVAVGNKANIYVNVSTSGPLAFFSAPRSYTVGTNVQAVVVGDFNGDLKPDVATANYATNRVGVLLGNGNGTFQYGTLKTVQQFAVGAGPVALAAGELNGDKKRDLVVVNSLDSSVTVLLSKIKGLF